MTLQHVETLRRIAEQLGYIEALVARMGRGCPTASPLAAEAERLAAAFLADAAEPVTPWRTRFAEFIGERGVGSELADATLWAVLARFERPGGKAEQCPS